MSLLVFHSGLTRLKATDTISYIGLLTQVMLEGSSHRRNPIKSSKACNGFAITSLLRRPLESLTRSNREQIMKSWSPSTVKLGAKKTNNLAFEMHPLDPAVLSLKARAMRLPTFYDVGHESSLDGQSD